MNPEDLAYQLHEDGDCNSEECPYCEPDEKGSEESDVS